MADTDETNPRMAFIPRAIREPLLRELQKSAITDPKPIPGGSSGFWREMGERFRSLRDKCNDSGSVRHGLGSSRQWGAKAWFVTGDQDCVNEFKRLWTETEVENDYPSPDPNSRMEYTWLNDVLGYATFGGVPRQGGGYGDADNTALPVRNYCVALVDLCCDRANAALKRERAGLSKTFAIDPTAPPKDAPEGITAEIPQKQGNPGVVWEDLVFQINDHHITETRAAGESETYGYAEFGFQDKRTGKPNQQWAVLLVLGTAGRMPDDARHGNEWMAIAKRVERVRKTL